MRSTIPRRDLLTHETKRRVVFKFIGVLAIVLVYFVFIALKYGTASGILITALTWSFFVLCTPIADAGFLLDFPIRLITKLRMIFSEILVWIVAIALNIYALSANPEIYQTNLFLQLFHKILTTPYPFWLIIILSALGTYLSLYFADELLDVVRHHERIKYLTHKKKYFLIVAIFLVVLIIALYNFLLNSLNIHLF